MGTWLADAIHEVLRLKDAKVIEIDDRKYSTEKLVEIHDPKYCTLKINSLTSLVEYIRSDLDELFSNHCGLLAHVAGHNKVDLMTPVHGSFKQRMLIMTCEPSLPEIPLNVAISQEQFMIMLQSCFVENDDLVRLMRLAGRIVEKNTEQYTDDGVTQKAVIKKGVSLKEETVLPRKVKLAPYRTFFEIEQPESEFVFRVSSSDAGPRLALYEADGGAWKNEAARRIKAYLGNELNECFVVIIA